MFLLLSLLFFLPFSTLNAGRSTEFVELADMQLKGIYYRSGGTTVLDLSHLPLSFSTDKRPEDKISIFTAMDFVEHQADEIADRHGVSSEEIWNSVQVIDFSHDSIRSLKGAERVFEERGVLRKLKSLEFVDLSSNPLDDKTPKNLLRLYDAFTVHEINPFVSIIDTPFFNSKVRPVLEEAKIEHDQETSTPWLAERLVFVGSSYLKRATKEIKIYRTFVEDGLLPSNWGWHGIHTRFFSGINRRVNAHRREVLKRERYYTFADYISPIKRVNPDDPNEQKDLQQTLDSLQSAVKMEQVPSSRSSSASSTE
tara:strand:- start:39 stop:971 length:933 start_codon:yes stop_codon:yes gene_type:complete